MSNAAVEQPATWTWPGNVHRWTAWRSRHPFAATPGGLLGLFAVPAGEAGSSVLALPSRGGRPCPSADLCVSARLPGSRAAAADHIAPWVVPTPIMDASVMVRVLAQEPGWVAGATVRYARVVSGIAVHLTGTGQVLPSMEWDDGSRACSAC